MCVQYSTRKILSVVGQFEFACRVIVIGRSFLSRMIELSKTVKKLDHHVTLNVGFREDLRMWSGFLDSWNGVSFFLDEQRTDAPNMDLYTDAAGGIGYGAYFAGQWFNGTWPADVTLGIDGVSIAWMELYPVSLAARCWGSQWQRRRILFHCDNQSTVHIINKGRSKSPAIMPLVRQLVLAAAQHNFMFYAKYVPGKQNDIADDLSHFQMDRFHQLAPDAAALPCQVSWEQMHN